MLSPPVLARWFDMVKDHEICIDEEDINNEALENVWHFSPREDEEEGITAEAVAEFIRAVIEEFREALSEPPPVPMLFYCWHDFQERTICFSLVSPSHGRLPFGCIPVETDDLMLITTRVVILDWLNPCYIWPMTDEELAELRKKEEEGDDEPYYLPVFVTRLP
jgi:hypothetical protein